MLFTGLAAYCAFQEHADCEIQDVSGKMHVMLPSIRFQTSQERKGA